MKSPLRSHLLIGLVLTGAILAAYGQVVGFEFVGFDDDLYVTDNPWVRDGFSRQAILWAFTHFHSANWHPITWLSHMLDVQLYGLHPMGHHWTNLQLHLANTLLLYLLLFRMTAKPWRSAAVALLFGVHPLHVESVAWVAERKDLLSTFFGLLTAIAYERYVRTKRPAVYTAMALLFALGLMAKPMLVTWPFVLLLLDYWPLGRLSRPGFDRSAGLRQLRTAWLPGAGALLREKIPLFVLVAGSSVVTVLAQRSDGAVESLTSLPIGIRIGNAAISYVTYGVKMLWPIRLAAFYPHPGESIGWWQVIGCAGLIGLLLAAALGKARRYPYLPVGLLWYLGTLIPVIGLVQVGAQAMADRYSYIPLIGLFIILCWGTADLSRSWPRRALTLSLLAAVVFSILTVGTFRQAGYWKNGVALFEHALRVTDDNHRAHNNLAVALGPDDIERAIEHYRAAVELKPNYATALYNLGSALYRQGRLHDAVNYLTRCLEITAHDVDCRNNLANILFVLERLDEAVFHFRRILDEDPDNADAHSNLANVLAAQGLGDRALAHYADALKLDPDHVDAHYNCAALLARRQQVGEALSHLAEVIRIAPGHFKAYNYIGVLLARQGRYRTAGEFFKRALDVKPDYAEARHNLEQIEHHPPPRGGAG